MYTVCRHVNYLFACQAEGSRPRTRSSAARAAAAVAAISSRTRSSGARVTAAASAPRRTSGRRTRRPAAAPRVAAATPPSMSEPPAPPVTSAAGSATAHHLPAAPRRRELTFSHPQTPSASSDRQSNVESEGLKTPATPCTAGSDCAVCLSPLRKGNQQQQLEVYRVRGCGVRQGSWVAVCAA